MKAIGELVRVFQALGQDTRFKIFKVLCGRTLCVCELEEIFGITQPAISHHLAILKDAGLVEDSREGQWVFYKASPDRLEEWWREAAAILGSPVDKLEGMDEIAARVEEIERNPKAPRQCRQG
ncbi:MAG: ArsR/SmtB family transcription factor [Betaproteobacteria bacterium]